MRRTRPTRPRAPHRPRLPRLPRERPDRDYNPPPQEDDSSSSSTSSGEDEGLGGFAAAFLPMRSGNMTHIPLEYLLAFGANPGATLGEAVAALDGDAQFEADVQRAVRESLADEPEPPAAAGGSRPPTRSSPANEKPPKKRKKIDPLHKLKPEKDIIKNNPPEDKNGATCIMCENAPTHMCVPCGHLVACDVCIYDELAPRFKRQDTKCGQCRAYVYCYAIAQDYVVKPQPL